MGVAVLHVGWVRRYGTADVITHHPDMVEMTVKDLTYKLCVVIHLFLVKVRYYTVRLYILLQ